MERKKVKSTSISTLGYESEHGTLEITFTNGRIYHYYGVPDYVYEEF